MVLAACQGNTNKVWSHLTEKKSDSLKVDKAVFEMAMKRKLNSDKFGPSCDAMITAGLWPEASRYEFGATEATWRKETFSALPTYDGFSVVPEKEAKLAPWRYIHAENFFTDASPERPVRTVYFAASRDFTKAKMIAVEDVRYRRDGSVSDRWIRHIYKGGGVKTMFHYRRGRIVSGMSQNKTGRYHHLVENGRGELGFYENNILGETPVRKDVYAEGVRLFSGLYRRDELLEVSLTTPRGSYSSGGGTETLFLEKTSESWIVRNGGSARYNSPDQSLTDLPDDDSFYRARMKLQRRINAFEGEKNAFLVDYRHRLASSGRTVGDLGIAGIFPEG